MEEALTNLVVDLFISSPDEGVLAIHKASTLGAPDFQQVDQFNVDDSPNLIPGTADNDIGAWIHDDAQTFVAEMAGVHFVDHDVPQAGQVAHLAYSDDSENHTTVVNAPIWSWDSGGTNHDLTVVYVVD